MSSIQLEALKENKYLNFSEEVVVISQMNHTLIVKFIYFTPVDFIGNNNSMIITKNRSNSTIKCMIFYGVVFWLSPHPTNPNSIIEWTSQMTSEIESAHKNFDNIIQFLNYIIEKVQLLSQF